MAARPVMEKVRENARRAAALVVMLDVHRVGFVWEQGRVAADLVGGLLIGAGDVVVAAQRCAVPDAGVQAGLESAAHTGQRRYLWTQAVRRTSPRPRLA